MQTAPAGLLRMRKLRNRHLKGDFVPEGGALPWRRQDGGAAQAVTEGLSKFATAQAQQPSRLASSAPSHASRPCVTSAALVRRCASGGQQFCLHMQNCQLMRARTPHCGAAHNAHIRPLHREGMAPFMRELSPKVTEDAPLNTFFRGTALPTGGDILRCLTSMATRRKSKLLFGYIIPQAREKVKRFQTAIRMTEPPVKNFQQQAAQQIISN